VSGESGARPVSTGAGLIVKIQAGALGAIFPKPGQKRPSAKYEFSTLCCYQLPTVYNLAN